MVELRAEYDHTRTWPGKVKGNLHWVSGSAPGQDPAVAEVSDRGEGRMISIHIKVEVELGIMPLYFAPLCLYLHPYTVCIFTCNCVYVHLHTCWAPLYGFQL